MPQIFLMMSPEMKSVVDHVILREFDEEITGLIASQWSVPESDIAFSAEFLAYERGEASIQIEIRYTAGSDEYEQGRPFDPNEERQRLLSVAIINAVKDIMRKKRKKVPVPAVSVWCKPFYRGLFISL
jgi:hypothetical protein